MQFLSHSTKIEFANETAWYNRFWLHSLLDGIPRSGWHLRKPFTMNGCSPAQMHLTITVKPTRNATIMVHSSHNRKPHRFSHCSRSHWNRKNTLHRHRLWPHGNCIKHNRSSCLKWKAITNCIRIEPKVIKPLCVPQNENENDWIRATWMRI